MTKIEATMTKIETNMTKNETNVLKNYMIVFGLMNCGPASLPL